jgi:CO dehydrogenase/acetyl-CoA synthase beta subunit
MSGTLNAIGSENTPVFEKQIMINNSFNKVFQDDKVQVEDDLDENREIYMYKDVQAYLQDIDFFFKNVKV